MQKMLKEGAVKAAGTGTRKIRKKVAVAPTEEAPRPKKKAKTATKKGLRKKKKAVKKKKKQPFVDKAFIIGGLLILAWHFGLSKKIMNLIFPEDVILAPLHQAQKVNADEAAFEAMEEAEFFDSLEEKKAP